MHARVHKTESHPRQRRPRVRIVNETQNVQPTTSGSESSIHRLIQTSEEIAAHDQKIFLAILSILLAVILGMIFIGV